MNPLSNNEPLYYFIKKPGGRIKRFVVREAAERWGAKRNLTNIKNGYYISNFAGKWSLGGFNMGALTFIKKCVFELPDITNSQLLQILTEQDSFQRQLMITKLKYESNHSSPQ